MSASMLRLRIRTAATRLRTELTPELKRQIAQFTVTSLGIALIPLLLLLLTGATYEPFSWIVLVCAGAAYGWFARTRCVRDELWSVIDRCEAYSATLEAQLEDDEEED